MGFKNKTFAKVKNIKTDQYGGLDVQLTISKKNQQGQYELCFSGWVRFVGKASEKSPKIGDVIQLLECDVTNAYVKNGEVFYNKVPRFVVFDIAVKNETISRVEEQVASTVFTPIEDFESVEFDDIPF
jgi:hypothetical protein